MPGKTHVEVSPAAKTYRDQQNIRPNSVQKSLMPGSGSGSREDITFRQVDV